MVLQNAINKASAFYEVISGSFRGRISPSVLTSNRVQTLQDKDGTIALLSDLSLIPGTPAQVVYTYLTAGTFSVTIPVNCTHFAVQAVGATGGGASGRKSATGVAAFGGGGSASANISGWVTYSLTDLGLAPGAVLSGTIGAGGVGGAAVTTDSTNGNPGTNGGDTFLRIGATGTNYLLFVSGNPGAPAATTAAGNGAGAIGANTIFVGLSGGNSSATASPAAGNNNSIGGGGGSAGAGISVANAAFATNPGGRGAGQLGFTSPVPAGAAIGQAGNNGVRLPGTVGTLIPGHGASGGASALTGAAGKGGNAVLGGGAGGGGAARDGAGNSSGAGGNGAPGALQIVFYCQGPGQPLDSDLTAIADLAPTSLGLIERTAEGVMATRPIGSGGAAVVAAADAAEVRAAAGLGRIAPTTNGVAVRVATANYTSPYILSAQTSGTQAFIEILNGAGAGKGCFFGITGSGADGDDFTLQNWQGGPITFLTGPTPGVTPNIMRFTQNGHLSLNGTVTPQWYTTTTVPPAASLLYGAIAILFGGGSPSTHLLYTDQVNWYRLTGVLI